MNRPAVSSPYYVLMGKETEHRTACGTFFHNGEHREFRLCGFDSYITMIVGQDGKRRYQRIGKCAAHKIADKARDEAVRRKRLKELHPDKLGREQTPSERAEYTALTPRSKQGGATLACGSQEAQ